MLLVILTVKADKTPFNNSLDFLNQINLGQKVLPTTVSLQAERIQNLLLRSIRH